MVDEASVDRDESAIDEDDEEEAPDAFVVEPGLRPRMLIFGFGTPPMEMVMVMEK